MSKVAETANKTTAEVIAKADEVIAKADEAIAKAEEITAGKAESKKPLELDIRVRNVIKDVFMDFKQYLGMPQEQKVYERKVEEYLDKVSAILKEEGTNNGRTAGNTGTVAGI